MLSCDSAFDLQSAEQKGAATHEPAHAVQPRHTRYATAAGAHWGHDKFEEIASDEKEGEKGPYKSILGLF